MNMRHDIGVASQIGNYGDAMEVPANVRWLLTSGTPGLMPDGSLPEGIAAQSRQAWSHIVDMLGRAGMTVDDLVKVTQYLIHAPDIAEYAQVRSQFLKDARPASMLLVVPALVKPGILVEVEIVAAKSI